MSVVNIYKSADGTSVFIRRSTVGAWPFYTLSAVGNGDGTVSVQNLSRSFASGAPFFELAGIPFTDLRDDGGLQWGVSEAATVGALNFLFEDSADLVGPAGPAGADGVDGAQGPPGADGVDGADSVVPGPPGPPGVDGADGADGAQGPPGADGADGAQGLPGADGADGAQGLPGADGADGADGAQGLPSIALANTGFSAPGESTR